MIFGGDVKELSVYVRELADLMGLRDWTIQVEVGGDDLVGYAGRCNVPYGQKFATIRLAPSWAKETWSELRNTCVHELIHCHMMPIRWSINNVQNHLSPSMFDMFTGSYTDFEELAVDGIATAWAETLPLPIKKNKRKAKS